MILSSSRYSNSLVVSVNNRDKSVQVIVPSTAESYTFNYVFYIFGGQDRVDLIANAFYNDPTLWWRIGDANPEVLDWNNVEPGTQIRVPNA